MRYVLIAAIVATTSVAVTSSVGATVSQEVSNQPPDAHASDEEREAYMNEVVCRRDVQVGSRVQRRRICMTRREQIRLQNATREGFNEFTRGATVAPPNN